MIYIKINSLNVTKILDFLQLRIPFFIKEEIDLIKLYKIDL